jgi:predicted  nucleic acid-binding Zn-ribbon protein
LFQVATILKEKEPQLVSDLLHLINSADEKDNDTAIHQGMNALQDPAASYSIGLELAKEEENGPTSPLLLGGKQLYKYPPGHITVSCEKGPPYISGGQRLRSPSQSSQGSLTNQLLQPVEISQSEHSFNMSDQAAWIDNSAHRYSSISNISDIDLYNPEQQNIPNSPVPMRSPEQIAWAMQRARDRFETGSNFSVCSSNLDSVCSERFETMSMISDVSGYEEEMFRIKKLLLDPSAGKIKYKKPLPLQNRHLDYNIMSAPVSHTEIAATHGQSQSKKQHQEEIHAMEKLYELKIQDMLRHQAHTEGKLEAARNEVEKFVEEHGLLMKRIAELEANKPTNMERCSKLDEELLEYKQKVAHLENGMKEAQTHLQQRELEAQQWREEKQAGEHALSKLRLESEELRLELDTKCGSVEGLRAKVAEQHSELQVALQAKLQAEATTASARAECEALRSSQIWYKDQLAKAQAARSAAQQQAASSAAELATKESNLENLRVQITNLNQQVCAFYYQTLHSLIFWACSFIGSDRSAVNKQFELIWYHSVDQLLDSFTPNHFKTVRSLSKGLRPEPIIERSDPNSTNKRMLLVPDTVPINEHTLYLQFNAFFLRLCIWLWYWGILSYIGSLNPWKFKFNGDLKLSVGALLVLSFK